MAHAAPTPGTSPRGPFARGSFARGPSTGAGPGAGRTGRPAPPDVFGRRTHLLAKAATLLATGLVYGYWEASISRRGGPITGWNLFAGFMTTLAFLVLYLVVRQIARRLPREPHAALWGAFWGSAVGFLYSRSGVAMFTCVLMSLIVAAAVTGALVYRYYTRGDAVEARTARTT
ncbi:MULTISPECIES: hypothetical protein [Streptomyces]|uniref:Integral membrane protein n=1 Tax=Streptomyces olivaceus TaxID=47716 RepID=A0ABS7W1A2_STROV|nr:MULTISPECIES: hypothetical protein [Streptomyces]MBZ6088707.1 hypothetical protein [Streptomyces olivaceus]MBZ6095919.1 hypothetical protein [Streptomyces olivaceus]MBZ6110782.1 hypothetical protein [Streptomyces olivaceus]MBZ6116847.1 hypothetical protein [Streptomyces olivaceus]MBZ6123199.1 hypothetical protein [Streptomyces olivaceus]